MTMRLLARTFRTLLGVLMLVSLLACVHPIGRRSADGSVVLSVIGTNDVHGQLLPKPGNGGMTTLSAYVSALRELRESDGGAVLLIDAGDMWQGTLESNFTEGASVVEAYNAMGYAAAAIGNHEFDFGPVGERAVPREASDDPRGALKRRAKEARFPLLAANVIDTSTGLPVTWSNVKPSTMVEVAGIRAGIIGVVTERALQTTIAANTGGLRIGSLSEAIVREARLLRASGAAIIIVAAHAGSRCTEFHDATDLSTCELSGEIMRVAQALPAGLVDHIIAGHVHQGIAHIVNGISITSSYSSLRAFSRIDFRIDRASGSIQRHRLFPPQTLCPAKDTSGECVWAATDGDSTTPAKYEGRTLVPDPTIRNIARRSEKLTARIKSAKVGVVLESSFTLEGNPDSALGILMTEALIDSIDADVAIHNVSGGIRAALPPGELTYGDVYEMFPFDNRVVVLDLSGADLRKVIEIQAHNHGRRAGISGMRVVVDCDDDRMTVTMTLHNGREIRDDDRVRVAANDFLAGGGDGIFVPATPDGGFEYDDDPRLIRDVVVDWLRKRGGRLRADQYMKTSGRRWTLPDSLPTTCSL
jgi:5'-nucleotidase